MKVRRENRVHGFLIPRGFTATKRVRMLLKRLKRDGVVVTVHEVARSKLTATMYAIPGVYNLSPGINFSVEYHCYVTREYLETEALHFRIPKRNFTEKT